MPLALSYIQLTHPSLLNSISFNRSLYIYIIHLWMRECLWNNMHIYLVNNDVDITCIVYWRIHLFFTLARSLARSCFLFRTLSRFLSLSLSLVRTLSGARFLSRRYVGAELVCVDTLRRVGSHCVRGITLCSWVVLRHTGCAHCLMWHDGVVWGGIVTCGMGRIVSRGMSLHHMECVVWHDTGMRRVWLHIASCGMTHYVMLDVGAVMIKTHGNYGRSDCIKGDILSTYIHTFINTYMYIHVQKKSCHASLYRRGRVALKVGFYPWVQRKGLITCARRNKACVVCLLCILKLGLSPEIPTQIDWNLKIQTTPILCIEVSSKPSPLHPWIHTCVHTHIYKYIQYHTPVWLLVELYLRWDYIHTYKNTFTDTCMYMHVQVLYIIQGNIL